jgi:hypothetical protein
LEMEARWSKMQNLLGHLVKSRPPWGT